MAKRAEIGTGNTHCVACKPGYTKVMDVNNMVIADCVAIANCELNTNNDWFDSCETCSNGFAY